MEGYLYQINRLIDDKDQLVAEKNENLRSHHKMWRELATANKQKDAKINDLIAELWKRSTESVEIARRHDEEMGNLLENHDRRTDLLELKLQRVEAEHAKVLTKLRSEHNEKMTRLQLEVHTSRRNHKIEKRALVKKTRDLEQQLSDAHRQLEEQDETYFKAEPSSTDDYREPSMFESATAPTIQPIIEPAAEEQSSATTNSNGEPHNAENFDTVSTTHSDSDMDEVRDFSSTGSASDSGGSDV
jgi:hypothetical protein